jgi:hypothetical protein
MPPSYEAHGADEQYNGHNEHEQRQHELATEQDPVEVDGNNLYELPTPVSGFGTARPEVSGHC